MHAELVRPTDWDATARGRDSLLWAFLLRSIQAQLYINVCTPVYCLHNRSSCRFFFPWREQPQQQYDEATQRIALRRRHAPDDQFVVPHNLQLAAFSPGTVNVAIFDYVRGADQCRSYACKYCGKPEPWYYLETQSTGGEANPTKRFLQTRNVGACMACKRLLGFHIIRSTKDVRYLHPCFTVPPNGRIRRSPEHLANATGYPDPEYYLNEVQYYFFRNKDLADLRLAVLALLLPWTHQGCARPCSHCATNPRGDGA